MKINVYKEHGYENRKDYLQGLAEENDVDLSAVLALADMLGPSEDFDGLITSIEDFAMETEHVARMPMIYGQSPYMSGY